MHLTVLPIGVRCVSCTRRAGSAGEYVMRPVSQGGMATTTYLLGEAGQRRE